MRQQSWASNCLKNAKLSCFVNGVNSGLSLCTVNILGVISTCGISFLSGFVDISILLCNSFSPFSLWIGRISFVVFHSKPMPWPSSAPLNPGPVCPCLSLVPLGHGQCLHQDTLQSLADPGSKTGGAHHPHCCFWCCSWDFRWQRSRVVTSFIPELLCSGAAISSGALGAAECAQHTLWMCLSLTKSKHWYNPPSATRLFSPC